MGSLSDPSPEDPPPAPAARTLLRGRVGWRHAGSWAGARVNRSSYLVRWLVLATVIGAVAGTGAIVFYEALRLSTHVFLTLIAGYHVPTPAGEGGAVGSAHFTRPWAIPLVVVLGGLLAGFLVFTWAPEAQGHGTDAAIDAVHHNPRGIRLRAVVIKLVASALTIGSGGSGGREGPTAQISAGFGSLLSRVLDLSPDDGRIAVSVGIGSGIGAIFGAPLGGAVLAADVVYREDFEYAALVPGVFASIVAYAIFGAVLGYHPLFATPAYRFEPGQLLWFAGIGLLAGGIGLAYSKTFYAVVRLSHRLPFSRTLRPAAGGLVVGLIALEIPQVLGTGYGWVQKALSDSLLHMPLWIVLLIPLARIAATALSIGTGGSGGVFGPGIVIGAFTGLAVWRVFEPIAPGVGHDPAPFVVVGMMAVFGGISRAPLAVMIMVAEMTGSIQIVAPAMVAVAVATFIVGRADDSIYRSQPRTRADSEAGRVQYGMPLLTTMQVGTVAKAPRSVVEVGASAAHALEAMRGAGVPGAPVVDGDGFYLGTVDADRLALAAESDPEAPVTAALDTTATSVPSSARLDVALEALMHAGGRWVTVTSSRRVVGILAIGDVVRGYQHSLVASTARLTQVSPHAVTVEERLGANSALARVDLAHAGLPPGCIVISVQHAEQMLFPTGATVLVEGDVVSALTDPTTVETVRRMIRGTDEPQPPIVERGSQMM
jgi:chloride channel protein, CIC family